MTTSIKILKISLLLLFTILLSGCISPQTASLFPQHIVGTAYWTFDEGTGTTASDFSGNGNTLTLMNGVSWTPDNRSGHGLLFNGVNSYALKSTGSNIVSSNPFTYIMRINPYSSDVNTLNKWRELFRNEGSWGVNLLKTGYFINFEISGKQDITSSVTIPADTWSHIAITYDGDVVKFYKNGIFIESKPVTNTPNPSTGAIYVGGYPAYPNSYFTGGIGRINIYNTILSDTQILGDYNLSPSIYPPITPPQFSELLPGVTTFLKGLFIYLPW